MIEKNRKENRSRTRATGLRVAVGLLLFATVCPAWAHDHINSGAQSEAQGSALYFPNGDRYSTAQGWVCFLDKQDVTSGWSFTDGVTFGSLPGTVSTGGPVVGHAAFGAFLELEFVDLKGPKGGTLAVWQRDEEFGTLTALLELTTGGSPKGQRIPLTESDGSPAADPYGHIHGREFWVDQPGLYVMRVRLVDSSTHGLNQGPIHSPSTILSLYLQAENTLQAERNEAGGLRLTYAVRGHETWAVEESPSVGVDAVWTEVHRAGGSTAGFLASWEPEVGLTPCFYRLRQVTGF
ncbi:MAG: hypothetical protein NTV12_05780 [Verrucomicrobia bacterium]|jgi:hypothetical protein|nr:hypothetical protein [Verrucomicrobiota bacterium]